MEAIRAELLSSPQAGPPLILLAPEQATFQMEQALIRTPGLKGFERAQVLSFRRLAWQVLQEVGGAARPAIGDLGKRMVLRALIQRRLGELRLFGRVAGRPGFIDQLAQTIGELHIYGHDPEDLQAVWQALEAEGAGAGVLGAKLHDLSIILRDYRDYLRDRFTDPDDYLTLLARRLGESRRLRGARVWVDGFQGFTPQEFDVLEALLRVAEAVEVTLCLDSRDLPRWDAEDLDPTHLFHPTAETYVKLRARARRAGVPVLPPLILDGNEPPYRFRGSPALAHLEREFFRQPGEPLPEPTEAVEVVTAANRRAEVEAAAAEVLRLVREEGLRFREIGVVTRDLEAYDGLVRAIFTARGIPHFIDRRRPVGHHPLVEFLRSAVELVVTDWAYEPVFRLLKTDLLPVRREDVDRLENYVLAHGIWGRAWYDGEPWRYFRRFTLEEDREEPDPVQEAELEAINRIREEVARPLRRFFRRVREARFRPWPARELAAELYQLLEAAGVPARIRRWADAARAAGHLEKEQEHLQTWNGVVELLDQVVESLGDEPLTAAEFLTVLEAGLSGLTVGLVPASLDQVVVGSLDRSRHPALRAVLILGVADRRFPRAAEEDVIFTDLERERLEAAGFELGPTARRRTLDEQFFVYLALTRASERIWLSFPLLDEEGRGQAPSLVLQRIRQLLPGARYREVGAGEADAGPGGISRPVQLAAAVAERLRQAREGQPLDPLWLDLYQWLVTDPSLREAARPVLAALGQTGTSRPLSPEVTRALYGAGLRTSVSRLESFAACPFQHFSAYALGLRERERLAVEAPHLGVLFHAALRLFAQGLMADGVPWDRLTPEEQYRRIDAILETLVPRLQGEIFLSTGRYRYLLQQVRRTLRAAVGLLAEHARRGRFQPWLVEAGFGAGEELPPLTLDLPGGGRVELRGRIDRIDGAHGPGGATYLRVVDYKSGLRRLSLGEVYYGLALQLLIYLLVATEAGALRDGAQEAVPAGVLYFPVRDPLVRLPGPEKPEEVVRLWRRKLRMEGLVLADPEVVRLMDEEAAGDLIPVRLTKDGGFARGARVATREQFQALFDLVRDRAAGAAAAILAGEIGVRPYRLGDRTPCPHCAYRPVCQFDPRFPGHRYRDLAPLRDPDVLARLAGAEPAAEAAVAAREEVQDAP
ncbi:MAG: helicase-exonuclease AddAB subunit AddB [Firmicutes bacterium]|nr:helicase-exonuclease AddAB subunit AddB [Bacillota bacterium]